MPYQSKVERDAIERIHAATWTADVKAKTRDPKSHPPTKPTRMVKCDTSNVEPRLNARLKAGLENPVRVSSGGVGEWPAEIPVRIDVHMVLGKFAYDGMPDCEGLMGHVIDLDFFTKQTRLLIALSRDPNGITVFANEEKIYEWTQDNDDLPATYREIIEDMNAKGAAWADQVDLQPGDFVSEDELGRPVIERVDDSGILDDVTDEDLFGPNGDEAMDALLDDEFSSDEFEEE